MTMCIREWSKVGLVTLYRGSWWNTGLETCESPSSDHDSVQLYQHVHPTKQYTVQHKRFPSFWPTEV